MYNLNFNTKQLEYLNKIFKELNNNHIIDKHQWDIENMLICRIMYDEEIIYIKVPSDATDICCSYIKEANMTEFSFNDSTNYCFEEDAPLFEGEYLLIGKDETNKSGLLSRIDVDKDEIWYILMKKNI